MCEQFRRLGLEDVHIDGIGNAIGVLRGHGHGPSVLVEAHMDTVFPKGSVTGIFESNGFLHAPGITANTSGLVSILAALRALRTVGIQTIGDVVFAGTVREEGAGYYGGMKYLLDHMQEIDVCVTVDGCCFEGIVCGASGHCLYEFTFNGPGGPGSAGFWKFPNPLAAAANAIHKIYQIQVKRDPMTTYCVSYISYNPSSGIGSIPPNVTFLLDLRSDDTVALPSVEAQIFEAVRSACNEENERLDTTDLTWTVKRKNETMIAAANIHSSVVEAAWLIAMHLTEEQAYFRKYYSTNLNVALEKGLPCVMVGDGRVVWEVQCHSLHERFPIRDFYKSAQGIFLLLLMLSGVQETIAPLPLIDTRER